MSKMNNRKVSIEGIQFDSKKEARRWLELKGMEDAGVIKNLQRQVPYILIPSQRVDGKVVEIMVKYIADFVYEKDGEIVVEDVKPTDKTGNVSAYYKQTSAYKTFVLKRKMMLYFHGIRIKEV